MSGSGDVDGDEVGTYVEILRFWGKRYLKNTGYGILW